MHVNIPVVHVIVIIYMGYGNTKISQHALKSQCVEVGHLYRVSSSFYIFFLLVSLSLVSVTVIYIGWTFPATMTHMRV